MPSAISRIPIYPAVFHIYSSEQDLKGKHIVIFDDNISSGSTLDDICLELQKYGVASILPITLAIIPKTSYDNHQKLK